jgi:hypothetical protein
MSDIKVEEVVDENEKLFKPSATLDSTYKPKKNKLLPMSPLAASATVINLILATGPFR